MKKIFFGLLLFCLTSVILNAKSVWHIEGNLKNSENIKAAYLYSYHNGYYKLIDTAIIKNNIFRFVLGQNSVRGIYKIRFSPFLVIENILFNFENIKIKADLKDLNNTLEFIDSDENKVLFSYLKFLDYEVKREKAFQYLLGFYDRNESFYTQLNNEMKRLKLYNRLIIESLITDNNFLLASKYIKYDQLPYFEIKGNSYEDIQELLERYWDNIDFSDTLLLCLPLFVDKIDNFFTLFENPELSREEQEELFAIPAEILLEKSKHSPIINSFLANKILKDAIQFNLHELYAKVAQKIYENDYCINEDKKKEISKKVLDLNRVAIGKIAPDFKITDELNLYSLQSNLTLIIFWESSCVHCKNRLQELQRIYDANQKKEFEIVAFSLDKEALTFKRTLLENGYKWINLSDFKGWKSSVVNDYCISSTPAMFLLDNDKKIIAKPVKVEHILDFLNKKSD